MTIESKELHGAKSNHLQGVHDQEVSGDVMIPGDIEEIDRNAFLAVPI